MNKLIRDEKTGLFTDQSISDAEKEGEGFKDLDLENRMAEIILEQENKKAERRAYTKSRRLNRKAVPFSEEAYKDFEKRQKSGGNEKIMMKRFKKYQVGDLVMGVRAGTINNIRVGKLVYGYYTINEFWFNCAWVIKCDDGKMRSFQCIKKIRSKKELVKINKKREEFLECWAEGQKDNATKHSDSALLLVLLKEEK